MLHLPAWIAEHSDAVLLCRLVEILQSGRTQNELEAANNLHALVAGGGKKKSSPAVRQPGCIAQSADCLRTAGCASRAACA